MGLWEITEGTLNTAEISPPLEKIKFASILIILIFFVPNSHNFFFFHKIITYLKVTNLFSVTHTPFPLMNCFFWLLVKKNLNSSEYNYLNTCHAKSGKFVYLKFASNFFNFNRHFSFLMRDKYTLSLQWLKNFSTFSNYSCLLICQV